MRGLTALGWLSALVIGAIALTSGSTAQAWGTQVIASHSCSYGKVTTTLVWGGNSPYASGQYVEMSYFDNGWKPYTTTSVGPFSPYVNTMSWDGLAQSTRHFLRFTQYYPDGSWDTSLTFRFDTPSCSADGFTVAFPSIIPVPGALIPGNPNPYIWPGDYDCYGNGGDGPNYIGYPAPVDAWDFYDLDDDGDFIGCEPGEG